MYRPPIVIGNGRAVKGKYKMAEYIFNCPQCGESIEADDSFCGMEAECPHCACKIIVPERHKVELKKANQAGGLFLRLCSGLKCMTRREFWTLKHSIIVGQAVVVALLFIFVVLLLCGKENGGDKSEAVVKEATKKVETRAEDVLRTEKADLRTDRPIAYTVSAETPSGKLLMYAELGETSFVEKVLKENPTLDVNRSRAEGNKTALYLACEKGYSDIVKLLLERKADAMICDDARVNCSALTVAARNGHVEVVNLLLAAGVDKESRDDRNRTALYAAAANNKPKVVQCLCEDKANVNVYGLNKWTPLTCAVNDGYVEVIKVLLKNGNGVDLEMRDGIRAVGYNLTPLFHAVKNNQPEIVELLCKAGAKVNVYNNEGDTPLTKAAYEGYTEVVKALLTYGRGIDLEMRDRGYHKATPLYLAALKNRAETVAVLCSAGANLAAEGGPFHKTPINVASTQGNEDVVKVLQEYEGTGKDRKIVTAIKEAAKPASDQGISTNARESLTAYETEKSKNDDQSADNAKAKAKFDLGLCCYEGGELIPQDKKAAADLFREAAALGHVKAQLYLGVCYYNGEGVQLDKTVAAKWFRKAAEQGDAEAQYRLGQVCFYGVGAKRDEAEGVRWFHKAAEQEYVEAQYDLGCCYRYGEGVTKNIEETVRWYRKAADHGYVKAQNNLGNLYCNGEGVEVNRAEAVRWYLKAAEQGYADAQFNVGLCYVKGDGVERNFAEGARWFQKAASQGYAKAQFNLGLHYLYGEGVIQDKAVAVELFRKAAEQGHSKAKEMLNKLGW